MTATSTSASSPTTTNSSLRRASRRQTLQATKVYVSPSFKSTPAAVHLWVVNTTWSSSISRSWWLPALTPLTTSSRFASNKSGPVKRSTRTTPLRSTRSRRAPCRFSRMARPTCCSPMVERRPSSPIPPTRVCTLTAADTLPPITCRHPHQLLPRRRLMRK